MTIPCTSQRSVLLIAARRRPGTADHAGADTSRTRVLQRAVEVRVRGLDVRSAVVEASRMDGTPDLLAVTVHAVGPRQILDLFCLACGLTRREHEVVAVVVDGLDTRAIAKRLSISHYTVKEHLQSTFGKVGVNSRLELTTRIIAHARKLTRAWRRPHPALTSSEDPLGCREHGVEVGEVDREDLCEPGPTRADARSGRTVEAPDRGPRSSGSSHQGCRRRVTGRN